MTLVRSILLRREAGILVMIVLFCAAVGFYKPQFLTLQSLKIILLLTPLVMIGAMAQMLVLVARHVDLSICLLYTSPSPRDLSTSRMPSSA